jgi:hypothetical protein
MMHVPCYHRSLFQIYLITVRFIMLIAGTHFCLYYRNSIHTIVGSIHIRVMCFINSRSMDAPNYGMSVSFQFTLIAKGFITLTAGTHLLLSLLQRLNSYYCGEHPYTCDVSNKSQICMLI